LANLTLARAAGRGRELAVRLALGAARREIIAYLLAESFIISLAGTAAGLLVAYAAVKGILVLQPAEFQRPELIAINAPVFLFAAVVAILTTLLFGLAPAVQASRVDLNSAMKRTGERGSSGGRSRKRRALVAVEVALALLLVSGAGLMLRSFQKLVETGIGFETRRLLSVDVDLPESRYPTGESRSRFFRSLLEHARSTPGVSSASVVDCLPLHRVAMSNFYIAGRPEPDINAQPIADFAQSSPDYLPMIGMRLVAGRWFTGNDLRLAEGEKGGPVIVNEAFVKQFFPKDQPLGRHLLSADKKRSSEIVGIVSDYRPMGVENGPRPQIFAPDLKLNSATLLVRTAGSPETMVNALREAVRAVDRDLATSKVETMDQHLHYWISQRQFNTLLMTAFASLALLLAAIGVYGVLSNMVASRRLEIGIRMAVGATPRQIAGLVVGQAMTPVAIGLLIGIVGSMALGRFLETLLFQVSANDAATRLLAALSVLLLVPLAILVPLRRALAVQCSEALREE
jgi:putative ABC transport system permease protein